MILRVLSIAKIYLLHMWEAGKNLVQDWQYWSNHREGQYRSQARTKYSPVLPDVRSAMIA